MAARLTLVLGGARSGKSRYALRLADGFARKVLIATAEARDDEMAARIAHHRAERDLSWITCEVPLALPEAIADTAAAGTLVVVDCLTLWLSNILGAGSESDRETDRLMAACAAAPATIVLISNEVGLGIVPDNALARAFRDAQGRLNQRVAADAETVVFLAAGLPLTLKSRA